jgi:hypothetical protein
MGPEYHTKEEYESDGYGFVTIEEAAAYLHMRPRAFNLLVAAHRDIFMRIMKYDKRWFIPDLYLKELSEKEEFSLIRAKYDLLAKKSAQVKGLGGRILSRNPGKGAGISHARGQTLHSPGSHLEAWS